MFIVILIKLLANNTGPLQYSSYGLIILCTSPKRGVFGSSIGDLTSKSALLSFTLLISLASPYPNHTPKSEIPLIDRRRIPPSPALPH